MSKNYSLSQAIKDKEEGLKHIKTCKIMFKCTPSYDEAIPYFKSAANNFKSEESFKEELFCREKLALCFQKTNSLWEEGNEHSNIARIYFNNIKDEDKGLKSIINAHNAFYNKGEYQDAIQCIYKLALHLRIDYSKDYSKLEIIEKMLKVCYDSCLKFGHVVVSKEENEKDYIYKTFKLFFAVLIQLNKQDKAIEYSEILYKSLCAYEIDKTELFEIYFQKIIGLIINLDFNNKDLFEENINECKNISEDRDDLQKLDALNTLVKAIISKNHKEFNDNLYEVGLSLDNELTKKLKDVFNRQSEVIKNSDIQIEMIKKNNQEFL